jgi:hypothetical protein
LPCPSGLLSGQSRPTGSSRHPQGNPR